MWAAVRSTLLLICLVAVALPGLVIGVLGSAAPAGAQESECGSEFSDGSVPTTPLDCLLASDDPIDEARAADLLAASNELCDLLGVLPGERFALDTTIGCEGDIRSDGTGNDYLAVSVTFEASASAAESIYEDFLSFRLSTGVEGTPVNVGDEAMFFAGAFDSSADAYLDRVRFTAYGPASESEILATMTTLEAIVTGLLEPRDAAAPEPAAAPTTPPSTAPAPTRAPTEVAGPEPDEADRSPESEPDEGRGDLGVPSGAAVPGLARPSDTNRDESDFSSAEAVGIAVLAGAASAALGAASLLQGTSAASATDSAAAAGGASTVDGSDVFVLDDDGVDGSDVFVLDDDGVDGSDVFGVDDDGVDGSDVFGVDDDGVDGSDVFGVDDDADADWWVEDDAAGLGDHEWDSGDPTDIDDLVTEILVGVRADDAASRAELDGLLTAAGVALTADEVLARVRSELGVEDEIVSDGSVGPEEADVEQSAAELDNEDGGDRAGVEADADPAAAQRIATLERLRKALRAIAEEYDFDQAVAWFDRNPNPSEAQLRAMNAAIENWVEASHVIEDMPGDLELARSAAKKSLDDLADVVDMANFADGSPYLTVFAEALRHPVVVSRLAAGIATGGISEAVIVPLYDVPNMIIEEENRLGRAMTDDEANALVMRVVAQEAALEAIFGAAGKLFDAVRSGRGAIRSLDEVSEAAARSADEAVEAGVRSADEAVEAAARSVDEAGEAAARSVDDGTPPRRGAIGLKDNPNRLGPEDLDAIGRTAEAEAALRSVAEETDTIIAARATNPASTRHLEQGAAPKPVWMKAKTVNELDGLLGGPKGPPEGLVGFFEPRAPRHPDGTRISKLENKELIERYEARLKEYRKLRPTMDRLTEMGRVEVVDGIVHMVDDGGRLVPMAGDIDPVAILDRRTGLPVSGERYQEVVQKLRESRAEIQHGAEVNITEDFIRMYTDGLEEGTKEWGQQVQRAVEDSNELFDSLNTSHLEGNEDVIWTHARGSHRGPQFNRGERLRGMPADAERFTARPISETLPPAGDARPAPTNTNAIGLRTKLNADGHGRVYDQHGNHVLTVGDDGIARDADGFRVEVELEQVQTRDSTIRMIRPDGSIRSYGADGQPVGRFGAGIDGAPAPATGRQGLTREVRGQWDFVHAGPEGQLYGVDGRQIGTIDRRGVMRTLDDPPRIITATGQSQHGRLIEVTTEDGVRHGPTARPPQIRSAEGDADLARLAQGEYDRPPAAPTAEGEGFRPRPRPQGPPTVPEP